MKSRSSKSEICSSVSDVGCSLTQVESEVGKSANDARNGPLLRYNLCGKFQPPSELAGQASKT